MTRKLKKAESDLIEYLLKENPSAIHIINKLPTMLVEEMNDGGMGSLTFVHNDKTEQRIGHMIAEVSLFDKDEVPVSFAIILDSDGDLYELDAFKADSSPLTEFPCPPYNRLPPSNADNV
jgi:hypothetical protein